MYKQISSFFFNILFFLQILHNNWSANDHTSILAKKFSVVWPEDEASIKTSKWKLLCDNV